MDTYGKTTTTIPWKRCLVFLLGVLYCGDAFADACRDAVKADEEVFAAACTVTAVREPYKLAWLILARLCDVGSATGDAAECKWPHWASFADTYPADPARFEPAWPEGDGSYPPPVLVNCVAADRKRYGTYDSSDPCEKIYDFRLNKEAFKYILVNELWYQEGLAARWKSGDEISFPPASMALQAAWKKIEEDEKTRYLWVRLDEPEGVLCGLVGLDVKSKILPDWFWFAFEHVDNPGRCDVIGCRDDFGQEPHVVAPAAKLDGTYPTGKLTEQLFELLPFGTASVWQNYRLKGVQTSFTDAEGKPTFLGNSAPQLEGEFLPQAMSCITCHTRAAFDDKGQAMPGLPVVHGTPDPSWFYDNVGTPLPWQSKYKQSNFIWSVALDACPKTSQPGN